MKERENQITEISNDLTFEVLCSDEDTAVELMIACVSSSSTSTCVISI